VDLIHPASASEVAEALTSVGEGGRILVVGGRRHMDRRGSVDADGELWTTALDRPVAYDPAEMLVVVEAGMRLHDLRAMLAEGGQEWPTEEPDDATVGGVIAAGIDPIRRLRVGLMRDSVVEMDVVLGDGRTITSGARVVKNVSGFDVHRLLTGSFGTLGVITQVALKVRPLPEATRTLETSEGGPELGRRLLDALWQPTIVAEPDRITVLLEGWQAEVAEQEATVRALAACQVVDESPVPGVEAFPDAPIVAEAGVVPSRLDRILDGRASYRALMGVGVVWTPCADVEAIDALRATVKEAGGVVVPARGPGRIDPGLPPAPTIQLAIKDAMDPAGILV
jgi:glycolate oxidase FAD binding subunit